MNKFIDLFSHIAPNSSDGRIHPARDWFAILAIGLLLFLVSVLWNAWLFIEISNGKTLGKPLEPASNSPAQTITNVQSLFQNRAAELAHYQSDYHFVDPSQPGG